MNIPETRLMAAWEKYRKACIGAGYDVTGWTLAGHLTPGDDDPFRIEGAGDAGAPGGTEFRGFSSVMGLVHQEAISRLTVAAITLDHVTERGAK